MPQNIYTTPPADASAYHRHVGARKPPSLRNKDSLDPRWLVAAAVLTGILIALWFT